MWGFTGGRAISTTQPRQRGAVLAVAVLGTIALGLGGALAVQQDDRDTRPAHPTSSTSVGDPGARAFSDGSFWNTPLPVDAPLDPAGDQVLHYLQTAPESGPGCLTLAGAGSSPWGQPIYHSGPGDPEFAVEVRTGEPLPELDNLRIPVGAEAADNTDGSMTVYDRRRGYVVMLTDASYDADADSWSAAGATVTYLASNGLHVDTGRSDDPRNRGSHRGNNGATAAVSWGEVHDGAVRHVLKVAAGPELSHRYVFPMVGSDGDYTGNDPAVPPQGLRLRIKPSIDLRKAGLRGQALVIARALQRFGFYIGDSGGTTALKLENTMAEGRGRRWHVAADSLCGLPFTPTYWDVVAEGYDPSEEPR